MLIVLLGTKSYLYLQDSTERSRRKKEEAAKYVQQQLNLLGNISLPFYYSV